MSYQPLGACIIVLDETGKKILLGKRLNTYKAGEYAMPGGHIEPGEKILETARRELEEETGLIAGEMDWIGVVKEWQEKWFFVHFGVVCKSFSGKLENREDKCEGWEWVELGALPEPMLPGHKACIELWRSGKRLLELEH